MTIGDYEFNHTPSLSLGRALSPFTEALVTKFAETSRQPSGWAGRLSPQSLAVVGLQW